MALTFIDQEEITVSGCPIQITQTKITDGVKLATFVLVAGGDIYWGYNASLNGNGSNAVSHQVLDDHWEIAGHENIKNLYMIVKDCEVDATINVGLWGTPQ